LPPRSVKPTGIVLLDIRVGQAFLSRMQISAKLDTFSALFQL